MDTTWRPNVEISPNCPRCGSSNTKFCYYNNYSLTQPRYFCKGCRRYWTKGGSLRNVPIGGGCRKSRRGKPWRLPADHHHGVISSKTHHHDSSLGRYPGCATARVTMMTCLSSPADSNQLMTAADGSHIDLALVYANYLNPPPDNPTKPSGAGSYRIPELGNELLIGANTTSNNYLLQVATGSTAVLSSGNNNVDDDQVAPVEEYTDDPTVNDDGYVLPPLPGEDSIFWAGLDLGGDDLQLQDPNDLSFANWSSSLDLSSTDHATN